MFRSPVGISKLKSAVVPGDYYWGDVVFYSDFELTGTTGTFNELSPSAKQFTVNNGATISTTQAKVGGKSVYTYTTNGTTAVTCGPSLDLGLSNADFTVEFWMFYSGGVIPATNNDYQFPFSLYSAGFSPIAVRFGDSGFGHALQAAFGGSLGDIIDSSFNKSNCLRKISWILSPDG